MLLPTLFRSFIVRDAINYLVRPNERKIPKKKNKKITEVWTFQIKLHFFIHFSKIICFFHSSRFQSFWENGWNHVLSKCNWNAIGKVQIIDRQKNHITNYCKIVCKFTACYRPNVRSKDLYSKRQTAKMAICSVWLT